jgi:hypothetical protein
MDAGMSFKRTTPVVASMLYPASTVVVDIPAVTATDIRKMSA